MLRVITAKDYISYCSCNFFMELVLRQPFNTNSLYRAFCQAWLPQIPAILIQVHRRHLAKWTLIKYQGTMESLFDNFTKAEFHFSWGRHTVAHLRLLCAQHSSLSWGHKRNQQRLPSWSWHSCGQRLMPDMWTYSMDDITAMREIKQVCSGGSNIPQAWQCGYKRVRFAFWKVHFRSNVENRQYVEERVIRSLWQRSVPHPRNSTLVTKVGSRPPL